MSICTVLDRVVKNWNNKFIWVTVSCSKTYLLAGDYIIFLQIPQMTGGANRLYVKAYNVKAYNVYAGGVADVKMKITQLGSTKWVKTEDTNVLWTFNFVGVTDDGAFTFKIKNEHATDPCLVSGFITLGLC